MADFNRIRASYEQGLSDLAQEIIAEFDLRAAERDHVVLLDRLFQAVLDAYGASRVDSSSSLDVSTSVMYAAADKNASQVLNVPLRSLVDSNTLSPWQARFLNGSLRLRHSVIVAGPADTGKSTLLNALVLLIPLDAQVASIEDTQRLPALRNRSFTVTLQAPSGTPAFAGALDKARDMKPAFILAGEMSHPQDCLSFLRTALTGACCLGTLETPDPQLLLAEWLTLAKDAPQLLSEVKPLITFMQIDPVGRPKLAKLLELRRLGDELTFLEQKPS
jgi:type IV secretory pathway ATPase VirB11/archaellum biosynthesis ATPase